MKLGQRILLTCGVAMWALATSAIAKEGILTVGTEGDAPKFSMADASGQVSGYDADVANAICGELKVKCEFVVQSFSTLIPSIDTNRFDVIISGLGITPERKRRIDYSIPYGSSPQYFAVPSSSPMAALRSLPEFLKALDGRNIGAVNGTTDAKFLAKNAPGATLKTYDSTTQMTADLAAGRLAAGFSDRSTWDDFQKSADGKDFSRVNIKVLANEDPTTLGQGMGVGMRKGNVELKARLDLAVCTLINNGTMTRIARNGSKRITRCLVRNSTARKPRS